MRQRSKSRPERHQAKSRRSSTLALAERIPHAGFGSFEPTLVCEHQSVNLGTESYPGEALLVLGCRFSHVVWQERQPKID